MNAFKALWRRAPLWQVCFGLAGLGTLLCILLPLYPVAPPAKPLAKLLDDGNYVPRARAHQPNPAPALSGQSQPETATLSLAKTSLTDIGAERRFSTSLRVNGFTVHLPSGEWVLLANQTIKLPQSSGLVYFLGKIDDKRLTGGIQIFAMRSNDSASAELTPLKGCQPDDAGLIHVGVDPAFPGGSRGCWSMSNFFTAGFQHWADHATHMSPIDRAAAGELEAKGITYPQDLVVVKMGRSEPWGLLEVRYLFSPEANGVHSSAALNYRDSDWYASNRHRTPEQERYLSQLQTWGATHWARFKQNFEDSR